MNKIVFNILYIIEKIKRKTNSKKYKKKDNGFIY